MHGRDHARRARRQHERRVVVRCGEGAEAGLGKPDSGRRQFLQIGHGQAGLQLAGRHDLFATREDLAAFDFKATEKLLRVRVAKRIIDSRLHALLLRQAEGEREDNQGKNAEDAEVMSHREDSRAKIGGERILNCRP